VSSIEPDYRSSQVDGAEECGGGLVVASGKAAVLLETSEEVLDEVASLVEMAVVATLVRACTLAGYDRRLARLNQRLDDTRPSVVGLVGNDHVGRDVLEQDIGAVQIRGLSRRQEDTRGIAERVHSGMDLRAQASSASPDGLLERPPFAPALC